MFDVGEYGKNILEVPLKATGILPESYYSIGEWSKLVFVFRP